MTRADEIQIQAELGGLVAESGSLGSDAPLLRRPRTPLRIAILDGHVVWSSHDPDRPDETPKEVDPRGALDRFLRIRTEDDILRFARRYGPLQIRPVSFKNSEWGERHWGETVANWFGAVSQARAVVLAILAMRGGKVVPNEAWSVFLEVEPLSDGRFPEGFEKTVQELRTIPHSGEPYLEADLVVSLLLDWIDKAEVRPEVPSDFGPSSPSGSLKLTGRGMMSVLTIQLLGVAFSHQDIQLCDACGQPYSPSRKPQKNRRHFCQQEECKRSGARLRKRDQLRRQGAS